MASVGEDFPKEQARCRRLILDYLALPNGAGTLGAQMIEVVLQGADRSIASGDPKRIGRDLKLMKEYQWEFEKRPNGIPVPSEEIEGWTFEFEGGAARARQGYDWPIVRFAGGRFEIETGGASFLIAPPFVFDRLRAMWSERNGA